MKYFKISLVTVKRWVNAWQATNKNKQNVKNSVALKNKEVFHKKTKKKRLKTKICIKRNCGKMGFAVKVT